ncbi:hypothetical protein [Rubinisphaera italica]|uniref:Uncharacterized protein n=1 Tax=Rubinisphaera italica TaxID=2527969 RepID=A0A5C5XG73_9PLAN|nr:hypothetical protein [Rubinisphaera italica]TWT60842.1 hypothetical protein Pan54_15690 [Rubinisphaera italica]
MNESKLEESWFGAIKNEVLDPILAGILIKLGEASNQVRTALYARNSSAYFQGIVNTCKSAQHLRLHVGNLNKMSDTAKGFAREAIDPVVGSLVDEDLVDETNKIQFRSALENISDRREMLESTNIFVGKS